MRKLGFLLAVATTLLAAPEPNAATLVELLRQGYRIVSQADRTGTYLLTRRGAGYLVFERRGGNLLEIPSSDLERLFTGVPLTPGERMTGASPALDAAIRALAQEHAREASGSSGAWRQRCARWRQAQSSSRASSRWRSGSTAPIR